MDTCVQFVSHVIITTLIIFITNSIYKVLIVYFFFVKYFVSERRRVRRVARRLAASEAEASEAEARETVAWRVWGALDVIAQRERTALCGHLLGGRQQRGVRQAQRLAVGQHQIKLDLAGAAGATSTRGHKRLHVLQRGAGGRVEIDGRRGGRACVSQRHLDALPRLQTGRVHVVAAIGWCTRLRHGGRLSFRFFGARRRPIDRCASARRLACFARGGGVGIGAAVVCRVVAAAGGGSGGGVGVAVVGSRSASGGGALLLPRVFVLLGLVRVVV